MYLLNNIQIKKKHPVLHRMLLHKKIYGRVKWTIDIIVLA